jgi:hypothetical protein
VHRLGEHPGERRVEAHEQRLVALAGQPPGLLGGEHRLAGSCAADDRGAPDAPEHRQGAVLALGQADHLRLGAGDLVAQHGLQLDRLGHRGDEQVDRGLTGRPGVGRAAPELERAIEEGRQLVPAGLRVDEHRLVGDQVGVHIGPEQADAVAHRVELDVGEGDRLACDRVHAGGPVGQLAELPDQGTTAIAGLLERAAGQSVRAGPPGSMVIATDLAGLDLDDEDPALGIARSPRRPHPRGRSRGRAGASAGAE